MAGTIICAVEEDSHDAVVQTAGDLAGEAGSRVLLVHVRADPKVSSSRVERERERHRANRVGQEIVARARSLLPEGVESEGRVLLGVTVEQLTELAKGAGAALIVVGASRRGPVASVLCASVSRTLSRGAPCPLVIVPQDGIDAGGGTQVSKAA